ncbi:MAG: glycoside hydrolase family 2 TIM barrel-domain containing protein [Chloroflexota bacterium]|nr:glycoside hydrolase family 2 TIM barrel-domain containing protein [Chloroflexota bacterium]
MPEGRKSDWKPVPGYIMTRWAQEITPENVWTQYPRPQMKRETWLNLNGLWDYTIATKESDKPSFEGKILVPYPVESALSGVKRTLLPDQRLWYRRTFRIPEDWEGSRVLLHFGAVDWDATVWVNGHQVGVHRGGYLPFSFEITPHLAHGDNELIVAVWDPTDEHWQQKGKQVLHPKTIWYTAVSGIWQTVWLEPVPGTYLRRLKLTPDIDTASIEIIVSLVGKTEDTIVHASVIDEGIQIAAISAQAGQPLQVPIPHPHLWSPDDPHLYDLEIEIRQEGQDVDCVESYFGMRKFSMQPDAHGCLRMCLNNQPLFQFGPLDQGYWPDGLYTPPTEDAMRYDVEFTKQLGFNMLRKHIKVETARFYYDCDRLGLIVWQDMPNGGKVISDLYAIWVMLTGTGERRDDHWYWRAGRGEASSREDFRRELREMVDHLHNFACIGMWVPFNEGWGQFDAADVADWLKTYDPTRPVDHASGWFDQGGADFRSLHVYFKALKPEAPTEQRGVILSEFGGYTLKMDDHIWHPEANFGFRKFATSEELTDAYLDLLEGQLKPWIEQGLSAAVYTQTVDVEIEVNGFLTYDREVIKVDAERVAATHRELLALANRTTHPPGEAMFG